MSEKLVAQIERLTAERDIARRALDEVKIERDDLRLVRDGERCPDRLCQNLESAVRLRAERAVLRARVIELEGDGKRLEFLLNHHKYETWKNYEGKFYCEDNETNAEDMTGFDTWREAIDAAKGGKGK